MLYLCGVVSRDVSFGPFRLSVERRLLLDEGKQVRLGARAFDILHALVDRAGAVVTHEELLGRVWHETSVDQRSLRVHLSALRKVLGEARTGERYIVNVPGKGYCFVAPVRIESEADVLASAAVAAAPAVPRLTRIFGREAFVPHAIAELAKSHFLSIVGPGGVGKTTVAVAMAERAAAAYPDGVHFVELAPLQNPARVASMLASRIGLGIYSDDPVPGIVASLRDRSLLLVFDTCEHVIDAAALLAERIRVGAPTVHLLVTSREPLRAAGEWVRRLPPLENDAAVELFIERALAGSSSFEPTAENRGVIAELCEALEGIPLAIELAAAALEQRGLSGLVEGLDDRFALLTRGLRTALPRQRTLRATLDWSYALLPEAEQATLRRLGIFAGEFSLPLALAVAAHGDIDRNDLGEHLANLVAKSLVSVDVSGAVERYRLLDMTRDYVREQLRDHDELPALSRRHAEVHLALFEDAEREWARETSAGWTAVYGPRLDDVRAALEWAFQAEEGSALAIRLTLATSTLWTQLALMEEYRGIVARALLATSNDTDRTAEGRLAGALGNLLFHTGGREVDDQTTAAFERSRRAAVAAGDRQTELFALSGACAVAVTHGDYPAGLAFAERFDDSTGPAGRAAKDRALAHVLLYTGDFERCQHHLDRATASFPEAARAHTSGVSFDHQVTIRSVQARLHWLMGRPDQALEVARECVDYARSVDRGVNLWLTLVVAACPLAFLVGGREAAQPWLDLLKMTAVEHSMIRAQHYAHVYDIAMTRRSDRSTPTLQAAMSELATGPIDGPQIDTCAVLGDEYVESAIVARATGGWCRAEMLRLQAEQLVGSPERAEDLFQQSLDLARRQGTRAWELRTATSLARFRIASNRHDEARAILEPVVALFTEGKTSTDVRAAMTVLETIS